MNLSALNNYKIQRLLSFSLMLCLTISAIQVSAQTEIKGRVLDSLTQESIPFSLIKLLQQKSTSISNVNGDFRLNLTTENLNDTLLITSLGYQSAKIFAPNALKKPDGKFYLKLKTIDLAEVTVKPIIITQLLNEAIKASSNRFQKPVLLSGYYREVVKTDTSITKYADGLLDYHIERDKKNRLNVATIVKQSRVKELKFEDEDKFDGFESKIPIVRLAEFIDPNTAYILDSTKFENYNYQLKETTDENSLYIITFEPKPNIGIPLYKGKILIDKTTNLILGVDYKFSPKNDVKVLKTVSMLGITLSLTDRKTIVKYVIDRNGYYPAYAYISGNIAIESKKLNQTNEFRSEFIATDYSDWNAEKPDGVFKKQYLYQNGNNVKSSFWESIKINPNTSQELDFLKSE